MHTAVQLARDRVANARARGVSPWHRVAGLPPRWWRQVCASVGTAFPPLIDDLGRDVHLALTSARAIADAVAR